MHRAFRAILVNELLISWTVICPRTWPPFTNLGFKEMNRTNIINEVSARPYLQLLFYNTTWFTRVLFNLIDVSL
jgi:hypothetical protein